jgi:ribonuclease T1
MAPGASGTSGGRRRYQWLLLLLVAGLLLAWMLVDGTQPDDGATDPGSGLPVVQVSALPPEAARTLELIDRGGPFPEPEHDGGTFENREALLPDQPMGYYKEYTVPTPGSDDRGARRIVAGDGGELYYTGDHYSSFSRIAR